ncbi:unnamed protein product [Spirodela intermedia]|uniref:HMA domain-containing protein n=1 Tax=Spirodela intermedia TaxID=51605 RepID=A0A7I8IT39_SPIIN|nr:unnamed protein product [Spirodela intermedia]CAA6660700.1 unnamed protein product [Spirodela intermedia]
MATVVLKVTMSCQGCVGAVKRVLDKMEGVESYDVNLKDQKVTVLGTAKPEAVLQTVSKTGKKTEFWREEAEAKEAPPTAAAAEEAPAAVASPEAEAAPAAAPAPAPAAAPKPPPLEMAIAQGGENSAE